MQQSMIVFCLQMFYLCLSFESKKPPIFIIEVDQTIRHYAFGVVFLGCGTKAQFFVPKIVTEGSIEKP